MANEYNPQYFSEFSDTAGNDYTVTIYEKNGAVVTPVELIASASPIVHTWDTDEVKAPIKGSSVVFSYINTGTHPLTIWYTEDDTKWKIIVECTTLNQKLFIGYLVQDDCNEDLVDYNHEVSLSFNDGLGLLKDYLLDENLQDMGIPATVQGDFVAPSTQYFLNITNTDFNPASVVSFTVYDHYDSGINITYTVLNVEDFLNGNYRVEVSTPTIDSIPWRCRIGTSGATLNFYRRNTLHDILVHILAQCGLYDYTATMPGMDLIYYNTLQEADMLGQRAMFEQAMVDCKMFLNQDSFKTCWDVLESILTIFKMTLFQANGQWVVIRWDEYHYGNPSGYIYSVPAPNTPIEWANSINLTEQYFIGWNQATYPENAPLASIVRPFKFVKETFRYEQPKYLIYNNDFQVLGPLITSYTVGTDTYYEYEAPGFTAMRPNGTIPPNNPIIRVGIDADGKEIVRALVLAGDCYAKCTPFEISALDKMVISYTVTSNFSQPGPGSLVEVVNLYDGTTNRYANENPFSWTLGVGWNVTIPTGQNVNAGLLVEIKTPQVPNDGLLYQFFNSNTITPGEETYITNFQVEYIPVINQSGIIEGQVHQQTQTPIIKNFSEIDILFDDSPRNTIGGTLFELGFTNIIQTKTSQWVAPPTLDQNKAVGELVTYDDAIDASAPRAKIEGTFFGLTQSGKIMSLATKLTYVGVFNNSDFDFLPGRMEIDYRNNKVNCTMYRLWLIDDVPTEWDYTFNYIYETK